jgi:MinD-like ATPase involved in chromosome partitioning or flagellar assembly
MHVVTFYSFKGGVGRTMALANTAAELIHRGRSVLVVDFDLEAPGLPTLPLMASASNAPGLVDYVTTYLESGAAPDVSNFLTRCGTKGSGQLWVMSAGRQDSRYSERLNGIDWKRLYEENHGYLMFEDMKNQWEAVAHPDYVLIDSRTGHTDVAGFCTRHLPDTVVAMFFPNEQNLLGMKSVVESIRQEKATGGKDIRIVFALSNLPNLDDEDKILEERLTRSRDLLGYVTADVEIHHYASLALLNQSLFVVDRPRSKLAHEYSQLVDAIVAHNLEDRYGALQYLARSRRRWLAGDSRPRSHDLSDSLARIASLYPKDPAILFGVAVASEDQTDLESTIARYDAAERAGETRAELFVRRAELHLMIREQKHALADVKSALSTSGQVDRDYLMQAIRLFKRLDLAALGPALLASPGLKRQELADQIQIADELLSHSELLPAGEAILEAVVSASRTDDVDETSRSSLALNRIAQRKFAGASDVLGPLLTSRTNIQHAFNFAMAEWGRQRVPTLGLFERVLSLHNDRSVSFTSANYLQCIAIARRVVGDERGMQESLEEARKIVAEQRGPIFNAWRYLLTKPRLFVEDLAALADGKEPAFLV